MSEHITQYGFYKFNEYIHPFDRYRYYSDYSKFISLLAKTDDYIPVHSIESFFFNEEVVPLLYPTLPLYNRFRRSKIADFFKPAHCSPAKYSFSTGVVLIKDLNYIYDPMRNEIVSCLYVKRPYFIEFKEKVNNDNLSEIDQSNLVLTTLPKKVIKERYGPTFYKEYVNRVIKPVGNKFKIYEVSSFKFAFKDGANLDSIFDEIANERKFKEDLINFVKNE